MGLACHSGSVHEAAMCCGGCLEQCAIGQAMSGSGLLEAYWTSALAIGNQNYSLRYVWASRRKNVYNLRVAGAQTY